MRWLDNPTRLFRRYDGGAASTRLPSRALATAAVLAVLAFAACVRMTPTIGGPPSPELMAQFWNAPADLASRDLFYGVGAADNAPSRTGPFTFRERKTGGHSEKYEVESADGRKWDTKLGEEAQSEVVSSRIVWAMGYHQPPDYYVGRWQMVEGGSTRSMGPARFRPHLKWMQKESQWSWHSNPFIDTKPFRGLVVLMMILNSTDLKDENNALYELDEPIDHARMWYTVKDLGATLGVTGIIYPRRNYLKGFQREAFIAGVKPDGQVLFEYHGKHQELLSVVRAEDVRWMCERLSQLSDKQWHDAFRAAGYDQPTTDAFIARIKEKVGVGLSLVKEGTR